MGVAPMHSTPDLLRELAARYAQAVHRRDRDALLAVFHPKGTVDHVMHIRYHDRYLPGPGGWRIQKRQVLVDWTETRPVTSGEGTAHG